MKTEKLRQKIIDLTGEDPIDMFGDEWEEYAEEYIQEYEEEIFSNKFGEA